MSHESSDAETGVPGQFERNRYFHGKLMTARDMEAEQDYLRRRMATLSRGVLGVGVVAGLDSAALEQQGVGGDARVPAEVDLRLGGEKPEPAVGRLARGDERRLAGPEFVRQRLHLVVGEAVGVGNDPGGVAGRRVVGEGVDEKCRSRVHTRAGAAIPLSVPVGHLIYAARAARRTRRMEGVIIRQ